MEKIWKRFVALVTGSRLDVFQAARIKLTFFYSAVLLSVVLVFSTLMYISLAREIRENIKDTIAEDTIEEAVIGTTIESARTRIISIDIGVVVFAGFLSYFLAGKTLAPIREALEREKQFTADASHELRTPLTILKTEAEIALKNQGSTTEELRGTMKNMVEDIDGLTSIVSELLQTAREHSVNPSFKKMDISEVLCEVVGKFANVASNRRIKLVSNVEKNVHINGNPEEIRRAFINIIQNALNYTGEGGEVGVELTTGRGTVEVKVKDSGVGISSKDLPHIFERFYKADKSRSNSGTGLGLAIVNQIISKHKGKITVSSKENSGTTVNVLLITS